MLNVGTTELAEHIVPLASTVSLSLWGDMPRRKRQLVNLRRGTELSETQVGANRASVSVQLTTPSAQKKKKQSELDEQLAGE